MRALRKQLSELHFIIIIPELAELHSSLTSYAICERHYNQIIATNQFYQHFISHSQENKRTRLDYDEDEIAQADLW